MADFPEGCIADIISFTTPRDACRLCSVSTTFRSAAESDTVWERFLPPDSSSLVARSTLVPTFSRLKDLYISLCDQPLLIDGGRKSFSLEKETGKKCFMISARELCIIWGDTPQYWKWISSPDARFEEVALLLQVCWLEISGKIEVSMLSPLTLYTAYLVFKVRHEDFYGFKTQVGNTTIGFVGSGEIVRGTAAVDGDYYEREEGDGHNYPKERRDGWMEIELGEFFYDGRQEGELEMKFQDLSSHWKDGLIVLGIEIRPK
ncbi:putative F-box protein PP2-B12 [Humulus lupulus]|uniref:putative F-box protein PP2-B12 n=1 Tax=Humulus lupulus TaxID=3486 RepID=UPI002B4182C7|nr:putative F-box protein PP2-B12 [Humulus lupulus]